MGPARFFLARALLLCSCALAAGGCARVRLNWAMERVQDRYVQVFYDVETAGPDDLRASARGLLEALRDPAIEEPPLKEAAGPERYDRLLGETRRLTRLLIREASAESREPLLSIRSRLSSSCQTCHEEYRGQSRFK